MLRTRLIPCLLIRKNGIVKTIKFNDDKYIGDPLNIVRIFNEKNVDEIIVLDIDATRNNIEPNYDLISNIASECRMPLCYGGGISKLEQIDKIINLGVEKISLSSTALKDENIIYKASKILGSQSIAVVLDIKKINFKNYLIHINNGKVALEINLLDYIKKIQDLGVGEIILNSIDNDGMMKGYDKELIEFVYQHVKIPLTILGGASSLTEISNLKKIFKSLSFAAGSLFVFRGKFRAVLIQYPDVYERRQLDI